MMQKLVLMAFLMTVATFDTKAANVTASGSDCGENCTWTFYDDGTMVISGQGSMHDWDDAVGRWNLPWKGLGITNVVVEDGITNVGMNSFFGCGTIHNVTLAPSVEIVGIGAFDEDNWVQSVTMSDSTVWLYQDDFNHYEGAPQISLNCYGDTDKCQVNFSNTPKTTYEPTVGCATNNCTHILSDMMNDGYCTSLRACKTLDDMKNDGQYCTEIEECKRFMDLVGSGYCEGFEACKEMFNADMINYDGKRYGSLEDLYNGNALPSITRQEQGDGSFAVYKDGVFVGYKGKRIYTLEEANKVSGAKNSIKIRYK